MLYNTSSFILFSNLVRKDQMWFTATISKILGFVLNFIFNIVYSFTIENSLGISIILLTLFVRFCMIPLAIKQQKSMFVMQRIQPDMQKIQNKYKDKLSDPEVKNKMNAELQKLYSKHGYNPLSGCLPMFIQLPIFICLYYIMQNPYLFIGEINNVYTEIANEMLVSPIFAETLRPFALTLVPDSLRDAANGFDYGELSNLLKILSKLTPSDWIALKEVFPQIAGNLDKKAQIEVFLGVNMTEIVGKSFPKIIFALLSGLTTFISSWMMTSKNKSSDPAMKSQQRIMNTVMPIIMIFITTGLPIGVAIYWITSNLFQICQQFILSKHYEKKYQKEDKK